MHVTMATGSMIYCMVSARLFISLDKFVDPDFRCCVPFFGQAARNLDVTLSQTPVEENSLLHVIRVHHLQLLSHSLKEGKYVR